VHQLCMGSSHPFPCSHNKWFCLAPPLTHFNGKSLTLTPAPPSHLLPLIKYQAIEKRMSDYNKQRETTKDYKYSRCSTSNMEHRGFLVKGNIYIYIYQRYSKDEVPDASRPPM